MIEISYEVCVRLEERLKEMRKVFGLKNVKIKDVSEYANKLLTKSLNRIEYEENNSNSGLQWKKFRNQHFDEIYQRENGECYYCTIPLKKHEATLDHKVSNTRGGTNRLDNIVLCCSWCNSDKGVLTDEEYHYKQLVNENTGVNQSRWESIGWFPAPAGFRCDNSDPREKDLL